MAATIFRPATAILDRLQLVWKIVLVAACLIVPTVVLGTGYRSGMNSQVDFAHSERTGVVQARPALALLSTIVRLRSARVAAALGDGGAAARADTLAAQAGPLVEEVGRVAAARSLTADAWAKGADAVTGYVKASPGTDPAAELGAAADAITGVNGYVTAVLNDSKLILDPDLDSYSAMDAWLLRAPVLLDIATSAGDLVAADHGHVERPDALVLAGDAARLRDAIAATAVDVDTAKGGPRDATTVAALAAAAAPLATAGASLADLLDAVAAGRPAPADPRAAADAVRAATDGLAKAFPVGLDRLLVARADRLSSTLHRDLALAAIGLLLALYLAA